MSDIGESVCVCEMKSDREFLSESGDDITFLSRYIQVGRKSESECEREMERANNNLAC